MFSNKKGIDVTILLQNWSFFRQEGISELCVSSHNKECWHPRDHMIRPAQNALQGVYLIHPDPPGSFLAIWGGAALLFLTLWPPTVQRLHTQSEFVCRARTHTCHAWFKHHTLCSKGISTLLLNACSLLIVQMSTTAWPFRFLHS